VAFHPLVDQALGPGPDQIGWYEVVLDNRTLPALWWDGGYWSDDAGGNERWSRNATDGIRSWRLLWAKDRDEPTGHRAPAGDLGDQRP
jgi:hypothetical protein